MVEKTITFITTDKYLKQKSFFPEPCKLNIPDWYKNLKHSEDYLTVKGCMPFLDSLTSGYVLKLPVDLFLHHNYYEMENQNVVRKTKLQSRVNSDMFLNINFHDENDAHPNFQLGECPFNQKNKDLPVHKIKNPWIIKTPPGYSCLFLPPMNNSDDRFSIIPGIVDTDTYTTFINFPFIINGDKYPILKTTIKQGTPYAQIIPFKRDGWKMQVKGEPEQKHKESIFFQFFKNLYNYKRNFWNKKSWK